MQRIQYKINNSRIWHLCSQDIEPNKAITLDNWTRYKGEYREIYYLNDDLKFLEVDHFNHNFKFYPSGVRKNNVEDFRRFYKNYLNYSEIT